MNSMSNQDGQGQQTHQMQQPFQSSSGQTPTDLQRERVSSLLDGELEAASVLTTLDALKRDDGLRQTLRDYALISDVIKGVQPTTLSANFADRVAAAIRQEPTYLQTAAQRKELAQPGVGSAFDRQSMQAARQGRSRSRMLTAMAASLAAVGLVSAALVMSLQPAPSTNVFVSAPSQQPTPTASWDDPRTRSLLDAHGTMAVKLRMAEEQ